MSSQIGEVAKKYNLYTKVTGGQRIDMFGAQKADLPAIWEELGLAGFESGQVRPLSALDTFPLFLTCSDSATITDG